MAKIRLDPTWVATISYDPNTGAESYSYKYPLKSRYGYRGDEGYVAFDINEIGHLLNLYNVAGKRLIVEATESLDIELVLHKSAEPPSDTNYIIPESTSIHPEATLEENYYKILLDWSLVKPGPTGPVMLNFQEAIRDGYTGFCFSGQFETNEVFIELEGGFDNPRPTLSSPTGGEDRSIEETIRFSWSHNSLLNQENFELRYRIKGTSTWIIVQENTNNRYYDLAPNILTVNEYEWQVRTTSEYNLVSPWSLMQVFNAAYVTPSPVFLTPTEGSVIEISNLLVEWSSVNQSNYEFELLDDSNNVIWSESKTSANQGINIENILQNNKSYKLRLRVNQEGNIFSSWTKINISVDYTEPAPPIITLTPDTETGSIEVDINNPTPTGTEPAVTNQELFRREEGGQWIKLANLLPNSAYIDYTPASEKTYDYRVTLYGNNDTSSTSDIFSSSVRIKYSQLNLTSRPEKMIKLYMNPSVSLNSNYSATTKKFAGRKKSVAEFGEAIEQTGTLNYKVRADDLNKLYGFLDLQETLLYRDERGRKMFIVATGLNVTDDTLTDMCSVSLSITEVCYDEEVD